MKLTAKLQESEQRYRREGGHVDRGNQSESLEINRRLWLVIFNKSVKIIPYGKNSLFHEWAGTTGDPQAKE